MGDPYLEGNVRIGTQRASMWKNKAITAHNPEVGKQPPAGGPLPPKSFVYGRPALSVKGPNDTTAAVISQWQTFDQNKQLRKYKGEGRKRNAVAANRAALDAKITSPKAWNRFCMNHREPKLFFFMPEHTTYSFEERRKVKVPNRPLKPAPPPHDMTRLLCNDYAREWFLKESAAEQHRINIEQIDKRIVGAQQNAVLEAHHAAGQASLRQKQERVRHFGKMKPLARITQPKYVREATTHLATFREGDTRKRGWRPTIMSSREGESPERWKSALDTSAAKKNGKQSTEEKTSRNVTFNDE